MTTTTRLPRPAKATSCPECNGTGRETEQDWVEVAPDEFEEIRKDYGPCEICPNAQGWFPPESPAERAAREAGERAEHRASVIREAIEHQKTCSGPDEVTCFASAAYHQIGR